MATSVLQGVKGHLECSTCLSFFTDPVTLACGHSFCRKCLTDFLVAHPTAVTRKVFPCSVCRQDTAVPDPNQPVTEWGKQLIPSFTLRRLVEQVTQSTAAGKNDDNCGLCDSVGEPTPGETWCPDCEMMLCRQCSRKHRQKQPDHNITDNTKSKRSVKMRCREHNKSIKYHCRDCNKSICSTCCILHHSGHKMILMEERIDEMKTKLSQNKQKVRTEVEEKQVEVARRKSNIESIDSKQSTTVSRVRVVEKKYFLFMKEKFQRDINEVNKIAEEAKLHENSGLKTAEIDLHIFESHLTMLREVLESESHQEINAAHEFCESGSLFPESPSDKLPETNLLDLNYNPDLDRAKQMLSQLGHVAATFEDVGLGERTRGASRTLPQPKLTAQMTTRTEGDKVTPSLRDITVMTVRDIEAVIVTDRRNNNVKCLYSTTHNTTPNTSPTTYHSVYQFKRGPGGLTQLKDNRVMVSVPVMGQLVTLRVSPDLSKEKTTKTEQMYESLLMMDNGQLLAGDVLSGRVDVLDVSRNTATLIRSIPTHLSGITCPRYLTVDRQDRNSIIISDYNNTLTCMTSEEDIKWTYSPHPHTRFTSRGVTTTQRGDVIVVDGHSHKIIVVTRSGEFKSDLLTPADSEITDPQDVHYDDRGHLFVTDQSRVSVFKLAEM